MQLKKTKSSHKNWNKVLHPNRYFIWAIIFIVVSFLSLAAYIQVSSLSLDSQMFFSELQARHVFIDQQLGFSVVYPSFWQVESENGSSSQSVVFENPVNAADAITVSATGTDMESVIRRALAASQETDYQKPGYTVALIRAAGAKGGPVFEAALVKTKNRLFYIYGSSPSFNAFVSNFKPVI